MLTHHRILKHGLITALASAALFGSASLAHAETLVGLTTTNSVFTFDSATPNSISLANNLALIGFEGAS